MRFKIYTLTYATRLYVNMKALYKHEYGPIKST